MKRRTVLAMLGALPAVTAAGCAGLAPSSDGGVGDREMGTGTDTGTATATPTPDEGRDGEVACPSFATDPDRTVCWPSADRIRSQVYLNASIPVFEPDPDDSTVETLEFVLHDQHPERVVGVDPHDWHIARPTAGGWSRVASGSESDAWRIIAPGERYTWSLSLRSHPTPRTDDTTYLVQALDDGTYAFGTVAHLGGRTDDALRVECVAVVEVRRQ